MRLKSLGLGCHVGLTYAGAFGYADDIALVAPSIFSLEKMISICELYAKEFDITFNPSKSKIIIFNADSSFIAPIYISNQQVASVHHEKHLGNLIVCDINDKNIDANV